MITNCRLEFSHEFDWDNVLILDEQMNYNRKLISEAIHIRKINALNIRNDFNFLYV